MGEDRLTDGRVLPALGKGWEGSGTAGPGARGQNSPGGHVCPGHLLLGPCRSAWFEPHHSGTESSSGKLASSPYLLALLHGWGAWAQVAPGVWEGVGSEGPPPRVLTDTLSIRSSHPQLPSSLSHSSPPVFCLITTYNPSGPEGQFWPFTSTISHPPAQQQARGLGLVPWKNPLGGASRTGSWPCWERWSTMQVPARSHWGCQEPQLSAPSPGHVSGLCVQGAVWGTRQPLPEDKEQVIPKLSVPWSWAQSLSPPQPQPSYKPLVSSSEELVGMLSCISHVLLFAATWTVACQALLSLGFSRPEY